MTELTDDLARRVTEAIDTTVSGVEQTEAEIDEALFALDAQRRELMVQKERITRLRDAARTKKRPGRKPGTATATAAPRRSRKEAAATAQAA